MGCSPSKVQDGAAPVSQPAVKGPAGLGQEPAAVAPAEPAVAASGDIPSGSSAEENAAACKVQTAYRGHAARKRVEGIRAEKHAQSLEPQAASKGDSHADVPVRDHNVGDPTVSRRVNCLEIDLGAGKHTMEAVAVADPSTSPDDSATAVVQIFGEEGANAVAAAFFDGDAATHALETVQPDSTAPEPAPEKVAPGEEALTAETFEDSPSPVIGEVDQTEAPDDLAAGQSEALAGQDEIAGADIQVAAQHATPEDADGTEATPEPEHTGAAEDGMVLGATPACEESAEAGSSGEGSAHVKTTADDAVASAQPDKAVKAAEPESLEESSAHNENASLNGLAADSGDPDSAPADAARAEQE